MRIPVKVSFGSDTQTLNIEAVNVPNNNGQSYIMYGKELKHYDSLKLEDRNYNWIYISILNNIHPGDAFTLKIGGSKSDTNNATQYSVLLYNFTNRAIVSEYVFNFNTEINQEIICPGKDKSNNNLNGTDIQLLIYSAKFGETANKGATFTNIDIIEGIENKVTTYMQFKITDCSKVFAVGTSTDNTTSLIFYIKEIWKNDSNNEFTYEYRSEVFENVPIYKFTLSEPHQYEFIDANDIIGKSFELTDNGYEYDISYDGSIRGLSTNNGYNLHSISIECKNTGKIIPVSIPLRDYGNNKDNFTLNTYSYYGTILGNIFKINDWYAKLIVNYKNYYYIMQAAGNSAEFLECLKNLVKNDNINTGNANDFYYLNASHINNYIGVNKYEFFNVQDTSTLSIDYVSYIKSGDVSVSYVIGDIVSVNGTLLGNKTGTNSNVNYWKLDGKPNTLDVNIKQLGDNFNTFFDNSYVPKYLAIQKSNILITAKAFSNLTENTKYYAPNYGNLFGDASRVNIYENLFDSSESTITLVEEVNPFNPGITPKSYEMSMYKNKEEKELYTISDYYSYDLNQVGKDSYGRGE